MAAEALHHAGFALAHPRQVDLDLADDPAGVLLVDGGGGAIGAHGDVGDHADVGEIERRGKQWPHLAVEIVDRLDAGQDQVVRDAGQRGGERPRGSVRVG